jgi:hypothetical protein
LISVDIIPAFFQSCEDTWLHALNDAQEKWLAYRNAKLLFPIVGKHRHLALGVGAQSPLSPLREIRWKPDFFHGLPRSYCEPALVIGDSGYPLAATKGATSWGCPSCVTGGLLLAVEQKAGVGGVAGYELTGAISGIRKSVGCSAKGVTAIVTYDRATVAEAGRNRADCLLLSVSDVFFAK